MNTAIRIALGVASAVAVGGAGSLVFFVFRMAATCGTSRHDPLAVLKAAVVDQGVFVALGYFLLFIGYLFGVRAVVRRRWNVPTKLHHLFVAAVLASATLVLVATPFLFA